MNKNKKKLVLVIIFLQKNKSFSITFFIIIRRNSKYRYFFSIVIKFNFICKLLRLFYFLDHHFWVMVWISSFGSIQNIEKTAISTYLSRGLCFIFKIVWKSHLGQYWYTDLSRLVLRQSGNGGGCPYRLTTASMTKNVCAIIHAYVTSWTAFCVTIYSLKFYSIK